MKKVKTLLVYAFVFILCLGFIFIGGRHSFVTQERQILGVEIEKEILEFESGFNSQIALALQMCKSPAIRNYMEDPSDEVKYEKALDEFSSYQSSFLSNLTFWIGDKDHKYYSNNKYVYTLDVKDSSSAWYTDTLKTDRDYLFNVDYDIGLKQTNLWVNALVKDKNGNNIGIAGTGIPLTGFVNSMYEGLGEGITMYMTNANGEITGAKDTSLLENKTSIVQVLPDVIKAKRPEVGAYYFTNMNGAYILEDIESVGWTVILFVPFNFGQFMKCASSYIAVVFSVFVLIALGFMFRRFIKPIRAVHKAIDAISSGEADLTKRVASDRDTPASLRSLVESFNNFVLRMQNIIKEIIKSKGELLASGNLLGESTAETSESIEKIVSNMKSYEQNIERQAQSVDSTTKSVNTISDNISSLNGLISVQSSSIESASAAVEEMIQSINSVNASAEKLSVSFKDLARNAEDGVRKQDEVNNKINMIKEQSEMLQDANLVISNIAEQTNLLAMNAAIEAAHAGESGKGFSVVADEIRKLSETSSSQSKTIGEQLKNIQDSISGIVDMSRDSHASLTLVLDGMKETDGLVEQITVAMEQQEQGSSQINDSLKALNDNSAEVKAASKVMNEGNRNIVEEIRQLQVSTGEMRNGMAEMHSGIESISSTGERLSDISLRLEKSIDEINNQIDQFTV